MKKINFLNKYGIYIIGFLLFITFIVQNTEPIKDGDLFFHLKYGQYMWENKTLIPNHTVYSWTPANKEKIYCAWIAELFLYCMYQIGGFNLLFAFRYFCILAMLFIIWGYAHQVGQSKRVITFFCLLVALLSSRTCSFIKPELVSLVIMTITAGLFFFLKMKANRSEKMKTFFLFPLIFLIWTNIHGVFLFGLVIFGILTVGELLNYLFKKSFALSQNNLKYLIWAFIFSCLASLITPYGPIYPINLLKNLIFSSQLKGNFEFINAYQPIFKLSLDGSIMGNEFLILWLIMTASFIGSHIFIARKNVPVDWALFACNAFLCVISSYYRRSLYYWPPWWALTLFLLINKMRIEVLPLETGNLKKIKFAVLGLFLFLSIHTCFTDIFNQGWRDYNWFGFGISYSNPEMESNFLKKHQPGSLLFNTYGAGSYLLFDLYPKYKVFIDGRAFPFDNWIHEYHEFMAGNISLDAYNQKYPFNVALLNYSGSEIVLYRLLESSKWRLVFYGVSGVIFVKTNIEFDYTLNENDIHRFDNTLKTLNHARNLFYLSYEFNDVETANQILSIIKKKFFWQVGYTGTIRDLSNFQQGMLAYKKHNFKTAIEKLSKLPMDNIPRSGFKAIVQLRYFIFSELIKKGKLIKAFYQMSVINKYHHMHIPSLYNAGVLAYQLSSRSDFPKNISWETYLLSFIKLAPKHKKTWVARYILSGKGLPENVPYIFFP